MPFMDESDSNLKQEAAIFPQTTIENKPVKTTSRLATASVIFVVGAITSGLLFCFFTLFQVHEVGGFFVAASVLFAFVAFVSGVIAIVVITIRRKVLKGYLYAFMSILLSAPFILAMASSIYVAKVRSEREKANTGLYNLRLLGKELIRYAKVHEGCLPVAERWCDLLIEHNQNLTEEDFRHPKPGIFRLKGESHFAFNKNLSGMRLADIPDDVVLIFEADGDWNLNGTGELLKTRYREKGCIAMLLVDQTVSNYWYYMQAMRKFDPKGTYMYYEKPRWKP